LWLGEEKLRLEKEESRLGAEKFRPNEEKFWRGEEYPRSEEEELRLGLEKS
jgi:hypothetical protein